MRLVFGFFLLGFLVGDMAGLTSESVVSKLIALLFALFGGSVLLLFQKFSPEDRKQVGGLLAAISFGMLSGIHIGILTTQYRLLSPHNASSGQSVAESKNPGPAKVAPVMPSTPSVIPPVKKTDQAGGLESVPKSPCADRETYLYLRSNASSAIASIDSRLAAHLITDAEAYQDLREAILEEVKR